MDELLDLFEWAELLTEAVEFGEVSAEALAELVEVIDIPDLDAEALLELGNFEGANNLIG